MFLRPMLLLIRWSEFKEDREPEQGAGTDLHARGTKCEATQRPSNIQGP